MRQSRSSGTVGAPPGNRWRYPEQGKPARAYLCRSRAFQFLTRPAGSCRRKGKWPRRLHRRRTLGANCPAALGAVFEVTAFDGWSLRSPAKTALETRRGWESTSEARPHSMRCPDIGRNWGRKSRHWKTRQRPSREKLRRSAGAKRRTKQAVRSSRTHGLRSFLAGCAAVGGIGAVGEWSPSIRSLFLFARAPENEDEKTGGTNRAAEAAVDAWQRRPGSQPRPDVQEGRPATAPTRAAEAQARGQRAEHQPARPSAVLAPSRVQRRGVQARRVREPCEGEAGVADRAKGWDGLYPLSLVILSCGVQEGRPFFLFWV